MIISYVPVTSVTGHIRPSWPFFFEVHSRLKMGAEQIICTNAIVARRVGLLHNLKRALLLEESTIVKKIRRLFEDFSPPPWRSYAAPWPMTGQVVGK